MISEHALQRAQWRKSSYSGGSGGDCLEVTEDFPGLVPVRDSKVTAGPAVVFRGSAWAAFLSDLTK
ncbi:DUF397 domain-containing protein [Streptomyces clavuligerus]|uniref:Putative regulatory protein n=1 Tax=Streptomyces clavuligerus TaxID=1901 RepID=B5H0K5_STRCL|nr:DUF397 domain-containing protein [Streptomyces clavuligerus]ANW18892.1 DUF397 domain-containing protein [Streptomyces clavuligerus]AXU13468.1 DUF397 domain-containing protein [Streptomyces clavuligerus]EDY52101.1 hypothetical protein SSCG_05169 [Streptomyces clavuligerus]EFG08405.1 Putative regulatory protein [Streptomyces clavuligerus]MBY6303426.1 DUF397 domain-containing protein [Streptomyces clavuligerus]